MFKTIFSSIIKLKRSSRSLTCYPCPTVEPGTQLNILQNGMRIATEESCNSPLVCVSMFVEAGPRYETPCNNGITHFIEHMAYKGFNTIKKDAFEKSLDLNPVRFDVQTHRDMQIFSACCLPNYVAPVIDTFSRIIADLALLENEIEAERCNIHRECLYTDIDPKELLFDYLHQTAFQGTSLAQRVIGSSQNRELIGKCAAAQYICEHYQPFRLVLATSGPVCHNDIVCQVETIFGPMDSIMPCETSEPCRYTGSEVRYRDDSMPLAHIAVAIEGPAYMSPDYFIMYALYCTMGSWHISQGGGINNGYPLARAAATANICYSYEPFFIPYRDVSLWGISYIGRPLDVEDFLYNVQNEWMHFACDLQFTDYERGMNLAKLRLSRELSGCINSCHDLGMQILHTCGRKSLDEKIAMMTRCKFQELVDIAHNYIYDKCPVVAAIGPVEGLPEYNRIRAGMYWLRF